MRGRGGWNRGDRGGFRGRGGFKGWDNNAPLNNLGINSGPNWDNGPPPVWQDQSMNRGGMMGRGNLRPPLMQNVMGRGRGTAYLKSYRTFTICLFLYCISDNWLGNNNSLGGRGGRDSDNWSSRGGGRDMDKWVGRGGSRDFDSWNSRGASQWRGNGNRRRNDDWEGPNQKRWRQDDNPEWNGQQKPWKRGGMNEEDEWQNKKQGSQWNDRREGEGENSFSRGRNEDRSRKPSKWSDRKVKEDGRSRKSVEHTSSKDESNVDDSHQTSAPMDLDNYEGESVNNIDQTPGVEEQELLNSNKETKQDEELEKVPHYEEAQKHHDLSGFNTETHGESVPKNVEEHIEESQQFDDYQNDISSNLRESSHDNIEEIPQHTEIQPPDNLEQQNMEQNYDDNKYKSPNAFQKDSHDEGFDPQNDNKTSQNNQEFVQNPEFIQNQEFESEPNYVTYDNEQPSHDQSYNAELSHNLNTEVQHSFNNGVNQAEKINEERFTIETSQEHQEYEEHREHQEHQSDLYFGAEQEPSVDKSLCIEQQNIEGVVADETVNAPPDNSDMHEINTEESNQR